MRPSCTELPQLALSTFPCPPGIFSSVHYCRGAGVPAYPLALSPRWAAAAMMMRNRARLMPVNHDAARGLLRGLAAGDRNGGPIQMALCLASAIQAHAGRHEPVAVMQGYVDWWADGQGQGAWDVGPIAKAMLQQAPFRTVRDIEETASRLDVRLRGQTAGANAVHRVPVLALASFIADGEELAFHSRQESRLTHWSALSQYTCAVVTFLCRELLRGTPWAAAVARALEAEDDLAPDCPVVTRALRDGYETGYHGASIEAAGLSRGGFCVDVLRAAVYFVTSADTFASALTPALAFAGGPNYCPVLVGALAGARFGAGAVGPHWLEGRTDKNLEERCSLAADGLLALFPELNEPESPCR